MTMAEGKIHDDEKLTRRGFFLMNDAVDAWPEFNLFTRGYVMSRLPASDPKYASAVDDQWRNLDVCAGATIDRKNPDYAPYMPLERRDGWKRACWSSWIAPHNFEGFFLNMGDMVVKAGDPATARKLYAQARLARDFGTWPFRDVLARRITDAESNVARFRAPPGEDGERRMMIESAFSCARVPPGAFLSARRRHSPGKRPSCSEGSKGTKASAAFTAISRARKRSIRWW